MTMENMTTEPTPGHYGTSTFFFKYVLGVKDSLVFTLKPRYM